MSNDLQQLRACGYRRIIEVIRSRLVVDSLYVEENLMSVPNRMCDTRIFVCRLANGWSARTQRRP